MDVKTLRETRLEIREKLWTTCRRGVRGRLVHTLSATLPQPPVGNRRDPPDVHSSAQRPEHGPEGPGRTYPQRRCERYRACTACAAGERKMLRSATPGPLRVASGVSVPPGPAAPGADARRPLVPQPCAPAHAARRPSRGRRRGSRPGAGLLENPVRAPRAGVLRVGEGAGAVHEGPRARARSPGRVREPRRHPREGFAGELWEPSSSARGASAVSQEVTATPRAAPELAFAGRVAPKAMPTSPRHGPSPRTARQASEKRSARGHGRAVDG